MRGVVGVKPCCSDWQSSWFELETLKYLLETDLIGSRTARYKLPVDDFESGKISWLEGATPKAGESCKQV